MVVIVRLITFVCLSVCFVHALTFESFDFIYGFMGTSSVCLGQVRISRSLGHGHQGHSSKNKYMSITNYTHLQVVHLRLKGNHVRWNNFCFYEVVTG